MRWHDGLNTEVTSCDLNIHEVTSWVFWIFFWRCSYRLFWISMKLSMSILNIHEVTSWVFWMFKRWRHENIKKLTSWVFWIFMKWPLGFLNIHEVTSLVFRIRSDVKEIFRSWRHGYFEIHNQNYTTSFEYSKYPWHHFTNIQIPMSLWIFKIIQNYLCHIFKMTPFEYSKYPWHHFKNIQKYQWPQYSHDVTFWIFKIPMPYG